MIEGKNKTLVIDDTYNSNLGSVEVALETVNDVREDLDKGRRIVVLGDMLELGEEKEKMHREVGKMLIKKADIVFTVGDLSRETFEKIRNNFLGKCFWFKDASEAIDEIKKTIKENDIILVKGSRGMKMERIVEAIKK